MSKNAYKVIVTFVLMFVLLVFLCRCGGETKVDSFSADQGRKKVIMVTDQAGLGDQGFNDSGWAGAQKAAKEFNLDADFIESSEQADYIPNLSIAARKADVVVAMGFLMKDAVAKVAPVYPKTRFIFIDGRVEARNVASFDFKGEEASFIAGYLAASVSKNKKIGIVNGMDIPPVLAYEYGFRSGITLFSVINKVELKVTRLTVGSFDDPVKGKSLAQNLLNSGCDLILQIAGNSGIGVIELFKQIKMPGYLISSDIDIEDQVPGRVLTCVMKRFDNAVYNALANFVRGDFKGGYYIIGLKENAVGITDMRHTSGLISKDTAETIRRIEALLRDGKISVPPDEDRFKSADFKSIAELVSKR